MINVSIVLQKENRKDDIINMRVDGDETHVTYKDGDRPGCYRFSLDHHDAYQYVSELLLGLAHDVEPFDYIQIIPCTGPSILYHVWELENLEMRELVLSQVHNSLCGEVTYNRYG